MCDEIFSVCTLSEFDSAYPILKQNFPLTERRDYKGQRAILNCKDYRLFLFKKDGKVLGIAGVWVLKNVNFIEHFAVEREFQNKGIGSKILNLLSKQLTGAVCLEVEPPQNSEQERRINFYKRNGFYLNDYFYMQPEYGPKYPAIQLKIMSQKKPLTREEFVKVVNDIYFYVYKKQPNFLD